MPIERDDESTSFDARPWGGQQRLIPLANRFARGTDAPPEPVPAPAPLPRKPRTQPAPIVSSAAPTRALKVPTAEAAKTSVFVAPTAMPVPAPTSVFVAPAALLAAASAPEAETILQRPTQESLPVPRIASHEIAGELESPIARISPPVDITTEPVPALTYCAVVSAPVEPMTMPVLTPVPQPMQQMSAAAPARHPIVAISRKHPPKAIPAYSVKHGCSVGGYVVPHLPRVAEVFRHSDSTVAVRRRPLTGRSLVAVPVGAVLAVVAILTIYLAKQPSASAAPSTAAVPADAAPRVMRMTTTLDAPAPVAVPAPVAAPISAAASPAGEPVIVDVTPAAAPTEVAAAEPTDTKNESPRRAHSSRHKKPRRIVAVDASTPLGNLRPGH